MHLSVQVALKHQISDLDPAQLCVIGVGCGEHSVAVRYQDRALAPTMAISFVHRSPELTVRPMGDAIS